jgi:hypothetical protein
MSVMIAGIQFGHDDYDEVNVHWMLERDGELTITCPTGRVKAHELSEALATAA